MASHEAQISPNGERRIRIINEQGEHIDPSIFDLSIPNLNSALENGWYARPDMFDEARSTLSDSDSDDGNVSLCGGEDWELLFKKHTDLNASSGDSAYEFEEDEFTAALKSSFIESLPDIPDNDAADSPAPAPAPANTAVEPVDELDMIDNASDYDPTDLEEMTRAVIWDSPAQRDNALQKHRDGMRNPTDLPGVFKHGVRYIRFNGGGLVDGDNSIECRTIIVTNLPETIELNMVLAQLRGELIIKAHLIKATALYGPRAAVVYFSKHECAKANFEYYQMNRLVFWGDDNRKKVFKTSVIMPDTNTYPLTKHMDLAIQINRTRHLHFENTKPSLLLAAMNKAGVCLSDFGTVVTGLRYGDGDYFDLEFRSIAIASRVREEFIQANAGNGATVNCIRDSCNHPEGFKPLRHTQQPIHPNDQLIRQFKFALSEAEGIHPRVSDDEHCRLEDPEAASWEVDGQIIFEDHKDETRDKTADWDSPAIARKEGKDNQGRLGIWEQDPISGALQFRAYINGIGGALGNPVMHREDWVKEWLCYNIDSKNPATQKAIDTYFETHGLLNLRRVNTFDIKCLWPDNVTIDN